uniref:Carboxymethylenebutenolidase homolog n=1 Tax=Pogona vitticeps TaxID=103695 RepID=A0ABM5GAA0_9SAUR
MANEQNPCPCDIGDKFEYKGLGNDISVGHIKAYLNKPSVSTDKAVIVIHDIFGWQLPNTRYIADLFTSNGYISILPDFFKGEEPWKPSDDWSIFNDWLKTRDAKNVDKETDVVLKYLKEQCNAKKIGVVGFCWGGAAVHHLMLKYSEFKTGVSVYGAIKLAEGHCNLKSPTFYIFGENDDVIPLDQVAELEQKLKQQCKVDFEVKIYPGQTHGFVHRKKEDINPQDKPYIEEGRRDILNWLHRYM